MKKFRRSGVAITVFVALFLGAVYGAVSQSSEALMQRQIRAASTEIELASHTLSMIELIQERPESILLEQVQAIEVLRRDDALVRTPMTSDEQAAAQAVIDQLIANAENGTLTDRQMIGELLSTLNNDARVADAASVAAEEAASRYLVLAVLSGLAIAGLVVVGQRRERGLSRSLRKQAHTDLLTGLFNRRGLPTQLGCIQTTMRETRTQTGMLFMDLDGFKAINDTRGHTAGDDVLLLVADRLRSTCQGEELPIRLGGDEFAVVLPNLRSADEAMQAAERFQTALEGQIDVAGSGEILRISIGVAVTDDPDQIDDLQTRSDLAMYVAKKGRPSRIALFEEEMRESVNSSTELLRALRTADYDDEFSLEFQPIVEAQTEDLFFVEALLRWNSPHLGRVSPGDFIPLAEQSGEILPLGSWVLGEVVDQLTQWQKDPATAGVSVSCNVSPTQFNDVELVEHLRRVASSGTFDTSRLIIEITESAVSGPEVLERLGQIQKMGYRVAIDDFGAGYSNLGQLIHTPFDILKVDRGLLLSLEKLDTGAGDAGEIMQAVSEIARVLGAPVVCEGVETVEQRESLISSDISHIQGWLISRALPVDEVTDFIKAAHRGDAARALPLSA